MAMLVDKHDLPKGGYIFRAPKCAVVAGSTLQAAAAAAAAISEGEVMAGPFPPETTELGGGNAMRVVVTLAPLFPK